MLRFSIMLSSVVILAVSGCVNLPSEPSIVALPGSGQSFDQFRSDDAICRHFAYTQVGGKTGNGETAPNPPINDTQQHYDAAYIQCMYAKGHQVPVSGQYSNVMPRQTSAPGGKVPQPPAGSAPSYSP